MISHIIVFKGFVGLILISYFIFLLEINKVFFLIENHIVSFLIFYLDKFVPREGQGGDKNRAWGSKGCNLPDDREVGC